MAKGRKHRDAELNRLRDDPQAAARLEVEDQHIPSPSSTALFSAESNVNAYRERLRQLVAMPEGSGDRDVTDTSSISGTDPADPLMSPTYKLQPNAGYASAFSPSALRSTTFEPINRQDSNQTPHSNPIRNPEPEPDPTITTNAPSGSISAQQSFSSFPSAPPTWSDSGNTGFGFVPWLWADGEPAVGSGDMFANVDVDSGDVDMNDMNEDAEVDWYGWVQSARGME